jgi:hypothetical protein
MNDRKRLSEELKTMQEVERAVRERLYSLDAGGSRALAVSALAASAAERAYARSDAMPEWRNSTSDLWRRSLADVWSYLEGDRQRHYPLSKAIAGFLTSPLNHNDGQEGPDDFDRPQTIAAYSAAASVIFWGVDFATTAIAQIFDLIDLEYDGAMHPERTLEFERERDWTLHTATLIVDASSGSIRLPASLLAVLRR